VVITDLVPPSGTVQVGTELRVIGQNFAFSIGGQRVYIDDQRVNAFKTGTSDTQLVFDIPLSILNVPQAGRPALLTVGNLTSSAQRTLTLLPALTLTGAIDVSFQGVTPTTPIAGSNATFAFQARSRANLDASYLLNAVVSVASFQANVQLLDGQKNPLPQNQLLVPSGQTVPFFVAINPVPPGSTGTPFTVTVNALAGSVTGSSGAIAQTVGAASVPPDNTIGLNFSSGQVNGIGTVTATQVSLGPGGAAKVTLNGSFGVVGSYNLTVATVAPAANWQVQVLASTANPLPIVQQDLQNAQGIANKTLDFTVTRLAGATSGQIQFTVQRQGQTPSRTFVMTLTAS
jgi:hypothetical protein